MAQFVPADEVVSLIRNGMSLGIGGFATFGAADTLLRAIRRRYDREGTPTKLNIVAPACPGDSTENGWGMSVFGADTQIVDSVITAHVGQVPYLGREVAANRIAAWLLPLGIFTQLFHAAAAGRPGVLTHVGKYTFVDPRVEGGRANQRAIDENRKLVEVVKLGGKEYLFYHILPMDACILRASYADTDGNLSFEREAIPAEQAEMAAACHALGGIVIAQVEKIVQKGSLHPRNVWVPGQLVDYVVVSGENEHPHTYEVQAFRAELCGDVKIPVGAVAPMDMGIRKAVARRGALELKKGDLANLGLGISDGIAKIAAEEGFSDQISLTIETGIFGGVPLTGLSMGAGVNADALLRTGEVFDLYDGGVLDVAFLSGAEIDRHGNVNVTKFGGRVVGPGGFINISQNAPKMCFLGTFTAGKQKLRAEDGKLIIEQDGPIVKFKQNVEQISFSGRFAVESGQEVLFITERAVFRLTPDGLMLTEIAPGIDLERHILAKMDFKPLLSPNLKFMDERIFREEKMGLQL